MNSIRDSLSKLYFAVFYLTITFLFLRGKVLSCDIGSVEMSFSSAKTLLFVLFGVGILLLAFNREKINAGSWVRPLPLLWCAALLGSVMFSENVWESIHTLGVASCYIGFFYAVKMTVTSKKQVMRLVFLGSVISVFVCLANIGYFIWVVSQSEVVPIVERFPFWPGKNMLGLFLVLNASFAFGLLIYFKGLSQKAKWWTLSVLLLNMACLAITFSRGAWVSLIGVLVVLAVLRPKIFIPVIVSGILFFLFLSPEGMKSRLFSIGDMKERNVKERLYIWDSALNMAKDHPLTGVGLGNFYEQYLNHYKNKQVRLEWAGEHAHNLYLHILAEMGILGFVALIGLLLVLLIKGVLASYEEQDPFLKGIRLGGVLALSAYAVYSLTDSTFNGNFSNASMFHVNLYLAIIAALLVMKCSRSQS